MVVRCLTVVTHYYHDRQYLSVARDTALGSANKPDNTSLRPPAKLRAVIFISSALLISVQIRDKLSQT